MSVVSLLLALWLQPTVDTARDSEMGTFLERADGYYAVCALTLRPLTSYMNWSSFADEFHACAEQELIHRRPRRADISRFAAVLEASRWQEFATAQDDPTAISRVTDEQVTTVIDHCDDTTSMVPIFAAHALSGRAKFHRQGEAHRAVLVACGRRMQDIEQLYQFGCHDRGSDCRNTGSLMVGALIDEMDLRWRRPPIRQRSPESPQ